MTYQTAENLNYEIRDGMAESNSSHRMTLREPFKVLMVISDMAMGGGETFFVRLVKGLSSKTQVFIHVISPYNADPFLLAELRDFHVTFGPFSSPAVCRFVYKWMYRLKRILPGNNLVDFVSSWSLRRLHRRHSFSVINAHLLSAERQVCRAFETDPVPIIVTDHGDYWIINEENRSYYEPVFRRSNALIYLSESNLTRAQRFKRPPGFRYFKIYNGYPINDLPVEQRDVPSKPSGKEEFVFGMISRGIPEKGWAEALEAFIKLRKQVAVPIRLLFVGESEHISSLQKSVPAELKDQIEFAGYQSDPRPFIARFTAGLLPTYYKGESLPTVIVEYLAQGKPVIATDTGGIREMLTLGGQLAGIIIGKDSEGRADVEQLCGAMKRMIDDVTFRERVTALALRVRKRFSMQTCVDSYFDTFQVMQHGSAINPESPATRQACGRG